MDNAYEQNVREKNTKCNGLFMRDMFPCMLQDLKRLFPEEEESVQVTLVEAHEILSAFDSKLRSYTEKLISQRQAVRIIKAAVSGIWKKFRSNIIPAIMS